MFFFLLPRFGRGYTAAQSLSLSLYSSQKDIRYVDVDLLSACRPTANSLTQTKGAVGDRALSPTAVFPVGIRAARKSPNFLR